MTTTRKLISALLLSMVFCFPAFEAWATHFRGAHFSWARLSGNSVRFTSIQEWKADDVDTLPINPGDGDPTIIGAVTVLFTGTDTAGESYRIVRYTVDHTYPNEGPFTAFLGNLSSSLNCCRLLSPVNAGGNDYRIETVVDLRDGNLGSPASTIPPLASVPRILQMPEGTIGVTRDLGPSISDPIRGFAQRSARDAEDHFHRVLAKPPGRLGGQTKQGRLARRRPGGFELPVSKHRVSQGVRQLAHRPGEAGRLPRHVYGL
jgi:hypothetical protein